jgi:cytochrome c-type biogenesis protein CcmE
LPPDFATERGQFLCAAIESIRPSLATSVAVTFRQADTSIAVEVAYVGILVSFDAETVDVTAVCFDGRTIIA